MCDEPTKADYAKLAKDDPEAFKLLCEYWEAQSEHFSSILKVLSSKSKGKVEFDFNYAAASRMESPTQKRMCEAYSKLVNHMCNDVMDAIGKLK